MRVPQEFHIPREPVSNKEEVPFLSVGPNLYDPHIPKTSMARQDLRPDPEKRQRGKAENLTDNCFTQKVTRQNNFKTKTIFLFLNRLAGPDIP